MIIIITIITIHLAGSPGSYFAYLKDCLEEWSKNKIKNNACRGEFKIRKEKKKAGRSSFFWTGAALATQGRYLLGRGRKLKKKKKKKNRERARERDDHIAQVMGFECTVQNIRYENHFSAIIDKQTKIFSTEYYVIYLFVRKENKEPYFEEKFANSYLIMSWLFDLFRELSQAERNS